MEMVINWRYNGTNQYLWSWYNYSNGISITQINSTQFRVTYNSSIKITVNHTFGSKATITLRYTGSTLYVYVNGVLKGSSSFSTGTINKNMVIGREQDYSNYTSHDLYCFRFYKRALTVAEIQKNYEIDSKRY